VGSLMERPYRHAMCQGKTGSRAIPDRGGKGCLTARKGEEFRRGGKKTKINGLEAVKGKENWMPKKHLKLKQR